MQTRPNFFIVGAPKCGTTALYHCLRKHPEIFMPHSDDPARFWLHKEPSHFCDDLGIVDWLRVLDVEDYLRMFEGAAPFPHRGTASPMKLMSESAPKRIAEFTGGEAKIIIMLRPPVSWMRSLHHDHLRYGYEDVADFRTAVALGEERDAGRRLPRRAAFPGILNYRRRARFAGQVRRYYETFGRERVFVGLMEDLNRDGPELIRKLLDFLGTESREVPAIERENESATLRATHFFDLLVGRVVGRLPGGGVAKSLWSSGPERLYDQLVGSLAKPLSDKKIDADFERELKEEFRGEVEELGKLIGRDLSHWQ